MVKCMICGVEKKCSIKDHLRHTHKINKEQYLEMYPKEDIISNEYREEISKREKKKWGDKEFKDKMVKIRQKTHNKPEFKEKMSKIMKLKHIESPDTFSGFTQYHKTEEFKEWVVSEKRVKKISESSKKRWENLHYREKTIETIKRVLSDGRCSKSIDYREKMSNTMTQLHLKGVFNNNSNQYKTGYYINGLGESFYYASSLEEGAMLFLDSCVCVESWTNKHKIVIPYTMDGVKKNYIPDFLIKLTNGVEYLVEMKGWVTDEVLIKEKYTRDIYKNYVICYTIDELKNIIYYESE